MRMTRLSVTPYAVRERCFASTKNRPKIMYRPTRTKGMPQSLKKNGALCLSAVASQKNANPPHMRLKGIMRASVLLRRRPSGGTPDQRSRYPDSSSLAIACSASWGVIVRLLRHLTREPRLGEEALDLAPVPQYVHDGVLEELLQVVDHPPPRVDLYGRDLLVRHLPLVLERRDRVCEHRLELIQRFEPLAEGHLGPLRLDPVGFADVARVAVARAHDMLEDRLDRPAPFILGLEVADPLEFLVADAA